MLETIKNLISARMLTPKGVQKGKLTNISQTLWAGDIAGSAETTSYEYKDEEGRTRSISIPVHTLAHKSSAKIGDMITIHNDNQRVRIDISRSKLFGRKLVHSFESTHEELNKRRFK